MKPDPAGKLSLENASRKMSLFRRSAFLAGFMVLLVVTVIQWKNSPANSISRAFSLSISLVPLFQSVELAYLRFLLGGERQRSGLRKEVAAFLVACALFAGACLSSEHDIYSGAATVLLLFNMIWMDTETKAFMPGNMNNTDCSRN